MMNLMNDDHANDIEPTSEDNLDDTPDLEEVEESSKHKIKTLQAKLKACESEKRTYLDDLQRNKAEFLNARKRLESQKEIDVDRATTSFVESLLPLCDSFEMAMGNTASWESVDESWRTGVASIRSQLQSILKRHGVEVIDPKGELFNPALHEALSTKEMPEVAPDTIVEVLQVGYQRNNELIRPAKVILSN